MPLRPHPFLTLSVPLASFNNCLRRSTGLVNVLSFGISSLDNDQWLTGDETTDNKPSTIRIFKVLFHYFLVSIVATEKSNNILIPIL